MKLHYDLKFRDWFGRWFWDLQAGVKGARIVIHTLRRQGYKTKGNAIKAFNKFVKDNPNFGLATYVPLPLKLLPSTKEK